MAIVVNVINGEVSDIAEETYPHVTRVHNMYPEGEVFVGLFRNIPPMTWRVLQRPSPGTSVKAGGFFGAMLPIEVHQLPECVQVVHLCTE